MLGYSRVKFSSYIIIIITLLLPGKVFRSHENESESLRVGIAAADEDDAEKSLRRLFINDIKTLLTHNQVFYNTYGNKDGDVDLAFDEARIAAEVIFLYPQIFEDKVRNINYRVREALSKKKEDDNMMSSSVALTADGK